MNPLALLAAAAADTPRPLLAWAAGAMFRADCATLAAYWRTGQVDALANGHNAAVSLPGGRTLTATHRQVIVAGDATTATVSVGWPEVADVLAAVPADLVSLCHRAAAMQAGWTPLSVGWGEVQLLNRTCAAMVWAACRPTVAHQPALF